jgi:hypothetical protein
MSDSRASAEFARQQLEDVLGVRLSNDVRDEIERHLSNHGTLANIALTDALIARIVEEVKHATKLRPIPAVTRTAVLLALVYFFVPGIPTIWLLVSGIPLFGLLHRARVNGRHVRRALSLAEARQQASKTGLVDGQNEG